MTNELKTAIRITNKIKNSNKHIKNVNKKRTERHLEVKNSIKTSNDKGEQFKMDVGAYNETNKQNTN